MKEQEIEMIKEHGLLSVGKKSLIKHLERGNLTRKEAMQGKCYDCMGYFIDGRSDCKMPDCTLYDYRPYPESGKKSQRIAPRVKRAK